jgi:Pentapeptide repeats (8 copies)
MANSEHLELLRQGVEPWNAWRKKEAAIVPDLSRANLVGADFSRANLSRATLNQATLSLANLSHAILRGANLREARIRGANFSRANLREAHLRGANLRGADFSEADLSGADLSRAILVETKLVDAILTDCRIYGISAWGVKLSEGTKQQNLVITPLEEPQITTDDLEVAQFIYLLLHNGKLQRVIDTVTSKVVLILGRFSPERKPILDALRDELRKPGRNYVPVVFDFEKPRNQNTLNTIMLLARMARFVIADVSDAKSVLMELTAIVPSSPRLAVQPIIVAGQEEPGMFDFFKDFPWFLKLHRYDTATQLLGHLDERVIGPVEAAVAKLRSTRP